MYPYIFLTITIFLASLSFIFLGRSLKPPIRLHILALSLSLCLFLYLYGAWVFASLYLKYVYVACYLIFLAVSWGRKQKGHSKLGSKRSQIMSYLFAVLLCLLSILYFTGTASRRRQVAELDFPFHDGKYFVLQGGGGLPTNVFHFGLRGALFAMDLVKLNAYGNRANAIFSRNLVDYAIFGDTIFSPCTGVVLHIADNNPDNIPPDMRRGPTNTNHVLIESNDYIVFMGHMMYRKVFVKNGDMVTAGQPIGLAGNSGFSVEPHLHIQVHAKNADGLPWYRHPTLPIKFYGKSYLLFEQIAAKGSGK